MSPNAINRRTFICVAGSAVYMRIQREADTTPIAKTNCGQIRGSTTDGVIAFKGIPYAGSPAGDNRFKPAPKLTPWTGVRDASSYGDQSIQPPDPGWPKSWKPAPASEDCLFLNIWTPGLADGKSAP